jgi:hypothetical protein
MLCHSAGDAIEIDRAPVKARCGEIGEKFKTAQTAGFMGPVELVFLTAMKKVEFRAPFLHSGSDSKAHHHETGALSAEGWIESRLIKGERVSVPETVKSSAGFPIDKHPVKTKPALVRGQPYELSMEFADRFRLEGFGVRFTPLPSLTV